MTISAKMPAPENLKGQQAMRVGRIHAIQPKAYSMKTLTEDFLIERPRAERGDQSAIDQQIGAVDV